MALSLQSPNWALVCLHDDEWAFAENVSRVYTLNNHSDCSRTAQSLRGGCSRRVHKIVYLAVNKGNIMVNFLLLKLFIANYYHL